MGQAQERRRRNIYRPPMPQGYVRPRFKIAIVVKGGLVWEHDVDEAGFPTSPLRPHYTEDCAHFPEGGYPPVEHVLAAERTEMQAARSDRSTYSRDEERVELLARLKELETADQPEGK